MTTQLIITPANRNIEEVVCTSQSVTIGRSAGNDIQLLDPKVSRFHCRVEQTDQGFMLVDLGSKNGSYVNGVRCKAVQITRRDVLKIGSNTFDLSSTSVNEIEPPERTREFQALPWAPPEVERTREIHLQGTAGPIALRERIRLPRTRLVPDKAKYIQFIKQNKFYAAACLILCLPLIAVTVYFYADSSSLHAESIVTSTPDTLLNSSLESEPQVTQNNVPPETTQKANRLAREADTIFETGDYTQALALYNKALQLDGGNILAKQGISATEAYVENLASICFSRGEKCILAFDYEGAVKEFETVTLLLEKHPDHKLYLDAKKFIKQAQPKVSQ